MIRHVVWDWNGTLLDDVSHAIDALNTLLDERGMSRIDEPTYRERFGFPVRNFYVDLGFDFEREQFERVSERFIARYKQLARSASTHGEARHTLSALREHGVEQSVLSAMEIDMLTAMLTEHELTPFLKHVRGLDHLHATSKVDLGVALMHTLRGERIDPAETLLVGDTLHDHETAAAMGCHCMLFVRGHQHARRLATTGARLIESLSDVVSFVRDHR